jgi:hypothetical protein
MYFCVFCIHGFFVILKIHLPKPVHSSRWLKKVIKFIFRATFLCTSCKWPLMSFASVWVGLLKCVHLVHLIFSLYEYKGCHQLQSFSKTTCTLNTFHWSWLVFMLWEGKIKKKMVLNTNKYVSSYGILRYTNEKAIMHTYPLRQCCSCSHGSFENRGILLCWPSFVV